MIRCERCQEMWYSLAYIVYSEDMKPMQVCRLCGQDAVKLLACDKGPGQLRVKAINREGGHHDED